VVKNIDIFKKDFFEIFSNYNLKETADIIIKNVNPN